MPPHHAAPDDEPVAQPVPGPQRPSRRALAETEPSGRRGAGRRRKGASTQETLAPLLAIVPGLRLMVGMVIAAVVILGLYVGRDVLLPVALAALLGFLLDPAVSRLKRWGLPRVVSVALVMVLALGALGAGALYVGNQVTSLSAELPTYQNTIRQKLRHVKPYFNGPGVWDGAVKVLNTVETEIGQGDARRRVQKVEVQEPEVKPIQKALELLSKVAEPLATTGIVFLFVVLILLDRSGLQDRLLRLMGPNTHMASDALDDAATRIGQYLRMQLFVNLSYGVPMALGLWWIGVPGAILWGILAAVLRFVPYIGPMASAVFPLTLAFAVDPGWSLLLWTLALILVLELISNNVIEPWLYGASTGLSTLSIILAATFWTALWGPVGLILSTPLTVCLLVLGRYIPGMGFLEILLGSRQCLILRKNCCSVCGAAMSTRPLTSHPKTSTKRCHPSPASRTRHWPSPISTTRWPCRPSRLRPSSTAALPAHRNASACRRRWPCCSVACSAITRPTHCPRRSRVSRPRPRLSVSACNGTSTGMPPRWQPMRCGCTG